MSFDLEPDDRGFYGLCIWGAEEKSKDEVEEEFGKYGTILNENRHTNKVFIRFGSKEEATACLTAYTNHPDYNVKPARKKQSFENKRNLEGFDSSRRNQSMSQRPQQSGFGNRNIANNMDSPGSGSQANNRSFQGRGSQSNNRSFQGGDTRPDNRNPHGVDTLPSIPKPGLIPVYTESEEEKNQPAPLDTKGVVLVNLHPYMKQQDVYELCAKAALSPPVHINLRNFKKPAYRTIYYAVVWVRTDKDVEQIVKGLHGLVVNDYELTVKSCETYEAQAGVGKFAK